MSDRSQVLDTALSSVLSQRIDEVCDRFEAVRKAVPATGARPEIEQYVGAAAEQEYTALLAELILLDLHYRRRLGEEPRPEDYTQRFPTLSQEWLTRAVAGHAPTQTSPARASTPVHAAADEESQPAAAPARQLRCPHCHN